MPHLERTIGLDGPNASGLVGLVDADGFCGGPIMVFRGPRDDEPPTLAPIDNGPAVQRAAAVDLTDSLSDLYDRAIGLGHVEAALFIGCARLSISELLAMDGIRSGSKPPRNAEAAVVAQT